jgi:hypothetical protein
MREELSQDMRETLWQDEEFALSRSVSCLRSWWGPLPWHPARVAGFEEHPMLSTFAVRQRAYPQTIYQLIMHDQATLPQAWQPIIPLAAIAPQPP